MAVVDVEGTMNVLEAARQRVINVFDSGLEVVMSTSGGKDSIVMSDIVYQLIKEGKIDARKLTVQFVDEEAMFDDVIEIVKKQRQKFMLEGAKFEWYCIQVKHYNCLNSLSDEETFILWDRTKKDVWVRPMPSFAIKHHPLLRERKDSYQEFLPRINKGKIQLIGVRASESVMRRNNLGKLLSTEDKLNADNSIFPIYDWKDDDIWLYIKENNLDFPKTYLDLWSVGEGRRGMRISQFFSIDTAKVLVNLQEHQPGLMDRVIAREPNAYIAALYWDSEMFRKTSPSKTVNKEEEEIKDYKKAVFEEFKNQKDKLDSKSKIANYKRLYGFVLKHGTRLTERHYKMILGILVAGDPKGRAFRGLITTVTSNANRDDKKERRLRDE